MNSDRDSADGTGADSFRRPDASVLPADDLRERMRLRLANQAPVPRVEPDRAGVHELVWNSVLETLSVGSTLLEIAPPPVTFQRVAPPVSDTTPVEVIPEAPDAFVAQEPVAAEPFVAAAVEPVVVEPVAVEPVVVEPAIVVAPAAAAPAAPTPTLAPARDGDLAPIMPLMPVLAPRSRATPARVVPVGDEVVAIAVGSGSKASKRKGPRVVAPHHHKQLHRHGHPVRTLFRFVLVVGLLGGAGYAGWYKFVRKQIVWAEDVRPSATFVEHAVDGHFAQTVPVVTLPAPEYEVALGVNALSRLDPTNEALDLLDFRAVGLLRGAPSAASVGHLLAPSTTAFYDGRTASIYRLDGATSTFQTGLLRALTVAIVDQHVHFTRTMTTLSASQRMGYWAMIDGAAAQVVAAKRLTDPTLAAVEATDLQARLDAAGVDQGDIPWYLSGIVGAADVADARSGATSSAGLLTGLVPPRNDAVFFDPAQSSGPLVPAPAAPSVPPNGEVLGMEFWYDAMVPTLGLDAARNAALLWTADDSSTSLVDGQACIRSTIRTATVETEAMFAQVLHDWAATRPASSAASVRPATDGTPSVVLSMCEPTDGEQAAPSGSIVDMHVFFQRSATERAVLERVSELAAPGATVIPACVVAATRNGAIGNLDVLSTEPVQVTSLSNVAAFCKGG
ncbi:MAG: hypothetical protein JWN62_2122 [Acidimicrobiales bacterium]|nr:hypothetical protein [Acidimicrobiales bacterium]